MRHLFSQLAPDRVFPRGLRVLERAAMVDDRFLIAVLFCCLFGLSACGQTSALGQVGKDRSPENGTVGQGEGLSELYVLDSNDEVKVTDIATSALAINAITFEASPLGDEPTNTTPAPISGGNPQTRARP